MNRSDYTISLPLAEQARRELSSLACYAWESQPLTAEVDALRRLADRADAIVAKAVAALRLASELGADKRVAAALAAELLVRNDARLSRQLARVRAAKAATVLARPVC